AEAFGDALDRAVAEGRVAHVPRHEDGFAPFLLDPARGLLRILVLVEVEDRHVRALAREQHRHRAADARIGAGHDGLHAVELAAAGVAGRLEPGRQVEFAFVPGLVDVLRRHPHRLAPRPGLGRRLAPALARAARVLAFDHVLQRALAARGAAGGRGAGTGFRPFPGSAARGPGG